MATGGAKGKIGEAYIEVTADPTKAKQGLKEAERATEQMANKVEQSTKKSTRSFGEFSSAVSSSVGKLTALVGVASAVAGAMLLVVKAIEQVRKELESGTKRAEEFLAAIQFGAGDQAQNIASIDAQITRLSADLEAASRAPTVGDILFGRRNQLKEQLAALNETRRSLAQQQQAQKLRADDAERAAEAQAKAAERAKEDADALERQRKTFEEMIKLNVQTARTRNAEDERLRELEDRRIEMERKAAQAYAETLERELEDRLFGGSGLLVGNNFTGPLQQINTTLNRLETRIPRTKI